MHLQTIGGLVGFWVVATLVVGFTGAAVVLSGVGSGVGASVVEFVESGVSITTGF